MRSTVVDDHIFFVVGGDQHRIPAGSAGPARRARCRSTLRRFQNASAGQARTAAPRRADGDQETGSENARRDSSASGTRRGRSSTAIVGGSGGIAWSRESPASSDTGRSCSPRRAGDRSAAARQLTVCERSPPESCSRMILPRMSGIGIADLGSITRFDHRHRTAGAASQSVSTCSPTVM